MKKIFIVSLGRTGTHFLAYILKKLDKRIFAIHEPDTLVLREFNDIPQKIKNFGIKKLFLSKFFGYDSLRRLRSAKFQKKISSKEISRRILNLRHNYINKLDSSYSHYCEVNCNLRFLEKEILNTFKDAKVIFITRHPFSWLNSTMKLPKLFKFILNSTLFDQSEINQKKIFFKKKKYFWTKMKLEQKLIWQWNLIHSNILKINNNNFHFFRYEDIFKNHKSLSKFLSQVFEKKFDKNKIKLVINKKIDSTGKAIVLNDNIAKDINKFLNKKNLSKLKYKL